MRCHLFHPPSGKKLPWNDVVMHYDRWTWIQAMWYSLSQAIMFPVNLLNLLFFIPRRDEKKVFFVFHLDGEVEAENAEKLWWNQIKSLASNFSGHKACLLAKLWSYELRSQGENELMFITLYTDKVLAFLGCTTSARQLRHLPGVQL